MKKDDVTKWALSLIAFFVVCRKSNSVPATSDSYHKEKQLSRGHCLKVGQDLRLTMTKTIQFNERKLVMPIPRTKESDLCPVKAFNNTMIKKIPAFEAR